MLSAESVIKSYRKILITTIASSTKDETSSFAASKLATEIIDRVVSYCTPEISKEPAHPPMLMKKNSILSSCVRPQVTFDFGTRSIPITLRFEADVFDDEGWLVTGLIIAGHDLTRAMERFTKDLKIGIKNSKKFSKTAPPIHETMYGSVVHL